MTRRYDDPAVSTHTLLDRDHDLGWRRMLSELRPDQQAKLTRTPAERMAPLTVGEQLEILRLRHWIERRMATSRPSDMRRAREAGATWMQIADVLDTTADAARTEFAAYIDGQDRLHDSIGIGLDELEAANVRALLDDTPACPGGR